MSSAFVKACCAVSARCYGAASVVTVLWDTPAIYDRL